MNRIYLIGFMGSGKSRMGRELSKKMNIQNIDLDKFIESSMFMTIPEIFAKYGEEGFRKIEHEKLMELSAFENVIISTGGGAPCFYNNMEVMNQTGITLFLNPTIEMLVYRLLRSKNKRPLIEGMGKEELTPFIQEKLKDRLPFYEQATLVIDPNEVKTKKVIKKIEKQITKRKKKQAKKKS